MKLSLIASSIRSWLFTEFLDSLWLNIIEFEVIFAGPLNSFQVRPYLKHYPFFKYIHTGNIKPAQCYEVARRSATGQAIFWVCDDAELSSGLLDKLWAFYCTLPPKSVISVKTNEDNKDNDLDDHRILGGNRNTPLMAPLGVVSREYLNALGGFDRNFVAGQYENDVCMRVIADGGKVFKYEQGVISIEHLVKHGSGTKFWTAYPHDRKILEDRYIIGGYKVPPKSIVHLIKGQPQVYRPVDNREVVFIPQTPFEPYEDKDLLTKSQSHKGIWE